ncbi:uncharacterized protein EHS24_003213 [Apiotrichum porosum]|uniref:Major facilitator superfamily (MFS) profile domain-containing protein n=1 Tax=Apiotrichum porosum TaxID=105984 RepID=A0A427XFQ5_9TREE|nr:uncharacterized protein EHS24_003213 [Apiotrichum porosum]RSH77652.1 hypothetical protein EHS24_003213 [Apiotrichum porosum]
MTPRARSPLSLHEEPSLAAEDRRSAEAYSPEPCLPAEVVLSLSRTRNSEIETMSQHAPEPEEDLGPPPDGGFEAWLVVGSSLLLLFAIFGLMNSTGQLLNYYLDHQLKGYSKSTVSWVGSVQTLVEFSFAMATGRWFDNHGARWLTIVGLTLATASVVSLAFCEEFYQLFLSMALFGFAGSMVFAPANAVAAHWFLKIRATAIAIISGGAGLGGVIYPIMIERLLRRLSYRNTMLVIAGFNFVLMLPSVFFMKARLPPRQPPPLSYLLRPWREPRFCFLVASGVFYGMNILSPFFYAITYAESNGVPARISNYAIALGGAGSVVGRLVMGVIADRIGVWRVFSFIPFATGVVMFAFWTPPNMGTGGAVAGLVLYGWMSGGFFSCMGSATASFSPLEEVGTRIGLLISSLAIPSLIGPVITGALIQDDKFTYAGIWLGSCFIVSGLLLNAPTEVRWIRRRLCDVTGNKDIEMSPQVGPPVLPVAGPAEKAMDAPEEEGQVTHSGP